MTEWIKTGVFAGLGLVVFVLGYITYPRPVETQVDEMIGRPLFADFTDPAKAAQLEIVRFNSELGRVEQFKVEKTRLGWVIPSRSNYPADAEQQMLAAATILIDLDVINVASDDASDHALYGVLMPDKDKLSALQEGAGVYVSFAGDGGRNLAGLIVGKKLMDDPSQRFVRIPGQDRVFTVRFDLEKLSTTFGDWIDKDLLQLAALDIDEITMKDYVAAAPQTPAGRQIDYRLKSDITVKADVAEGWVAKEIAAYRINTERSVRRLMDYEELDQDKLDELKSAIDNLEIVDVYRKPNELSATLDIDPQAANDQERTEALIGPGLYPVKQSGQVELLGAYGEVIVGMKDGYDYVLKFGNIASSQPNSGDKLPRNLFVAVRPNPDKFPRPALETPPSLEADDAPPTPGGATGDAPAAEKPSGAQIRRLTAERERILKENQRKLDAWNEKRDQAVKRAKELNTRFAQWYYVISEDAYKRIHLTRADLIQENAKAAEEGFSVDAFRKLESEGLKKTKPPEPPTK